MNSIFKLKDIIQSTNYKNTDNLIDKVMGININKEFMPTIGNITKKNLTRYKIIYKDDFACNLMHIGRDEVLVIAKYNENNPAIVSSSYKTFKIKNENVLPDYLSLYFKRPVMDRMSWFYTDSSIRGSLAWNDFVEFEITIPPLSIQQKIIKINNLLNDQIEIINNINNNLEQLCDIIYKMFFVNFRYFNNHIPSSFKEVKIKDVVKCELGGTPSRSKEEYWGGNISWINSSKINEFRIITASETITEEGLTSSSTKLLPKKTTVLAITGATLGQVSLLEIDSCANQSVIGVLENDKIPYEYIYPMIKNKINELLTKQTGAAQQHINKDNVESLQILIPDKENMNEYKKLTKSLYERISKNCFEKEYLIKLRDTLLPKLMSGEIDVSYINFDLF